MASKKPSIEVMRERAIKAKALGLDVFVPELPEDKVLGFELKNVNAVESEKPKPDLSLPKKTLKPTPEDIIWLFHALGCEVKQDEFPSAGIRGWFYAMKSDPKLQSQFYSEMMEVIKPNKKQVDLNDRYTDANRPLTRLLDSVESASKSAILSAGSEDS